MMDKCKHGYTVCSECGIQPDIPSDIEERHAAHKRAVDFNQMCAEVMELREIWENKTELYVAPNGFKFQRSHFDPYHDASDLVQVVDYIMDKSSRGHKRMLTINIISTNVLSAFRKFIKMYHEDTINRVR